MIDSADSSAPREAPGEASELYWRLWENGRRPDLDSFVATHALPPGELAGVVRIDQHERWRLGEPVPAEEYFRRFPALAADSEAAVDLIYHEFLLRERAGERPSVAEFVGRFPAHAAVLRHQIELHGALGTPLSGRETLRPSIATPATRVGGVTWRENAPAPVEQRAAPRRLPEEFGRYRILRLLGQGGMGAVYLAHDTQLERDVALKVPRLGEDADAATIARFYREARVAATFVHPNLCPVYEVGEIDGIHYLTMPYLKGEPLSEWLRRESPVSVTVAIRLCSRIARALHDAHQAGVLHRDLKPANIMLDARGEPIVMDFGLARRGGARDPRVSTSGMILGTPVYCSPEQIGGDPQTLGPPCDIYSLGVILYEMLAGDVPFRGAVHEVLRQVLSEPPPPLGRARPELDRRVEAVCLQALAKEPRQRFANMDEFATALETCLTPDPAATHRQRLAPETDKITSRSHRRVKTRRRLLLSVALLLLLSAAWPIWYFASRPTVPPEPPDLFHAGAHWTGTFRFRPPLPPTPGDVALTVMRREGKRFWGQYATEQEKYRWEIEGEIEGRSVRWVLQRFLGDTDPVSGAASVEATCDGETLQGVFKDDNSEADMTLRRRR